MAIPIDNYVRVTSGVGAGATTPLRQLIARLFTTSAEIPTDTVVEFSDAASVINYFGANSEEALRATYYFGFVSKSITSPRMISFARWANVDVGATILGGEHAEALTSFAAIDAGGLTITLGGTPAALTGLDFSAATSFADVATTLQTAIRGAGGSFASATVTYNAVRQRFEFDSGNTGNETITVTDGAQTPLAALGWVGTGARLSAGSAAQTTVEVLTETTDRTNNFGSFLFQVDLTEGQYVANGNWNQAQNVRFMQMVPVTETNASDLSAALIGIAGNAMTLTDSATEYPEMLPMAILAATDYSATGSVVNYMFHEDGRLTPTVTTQADANIYDPLRVNYMGQTQTAGAFISFYQRGVLTGSATAPVDMNTYANEMWLKDFATTQFLTLLRSSTRISANAAGRAAGIATIESAVNAALNNGTISVGGTLNNSTREFIQNQTGDPRAYIQVENIGFWFNVEFRVDTETDGSTSNVLVYTLIYNDDDVIRMVDGRHILV